MRNRRVIAVTGATILAAGGISLMTGLPASVAGPEPNRGAAAKGSKAERSVSRQQAARTAERNIEKRTGKSARVTGIGREDDFGARWEVEVTLANGREFDVYVNPRGRVIRVVAKGRSGRAVANSASSVESTIDWIEAGQAALSAFESETGRNAEVLELEREDDDGVAWEVKLLDPTEGAEFTVELDGNGEIVDVKTEGDHGDEESGDKYGDEDHDEKGEDRD